MLASTIHDHPRLLTRLPKPLRRGMFGGCWLGATGFVFTLSPPTLAAGTPANSSWLSTPTPLTSDDGIKINGNHQKRW
jgi:hypothetical protein